MSSEWKDYRLEEIAIPKRGLIDGPFGSDLPASDYRDSGVPVIRGGNLSLGGRRFQDSGFIYVSEDTAKRLERSLCYPGDIVLTKKGTLGQIGLIPQNARFSKYLLSSNQMKLTVNEKIADYEFVYLLLSAKEQIEKIQRESEYTGVPKINLSYLKNFSISLPTLPTQRRIASILTALDDKIELNRGMNETLEGMAQALWREWFGKYASGEEELPEGWKKIKLGDCCIRITKGTTPTTLKKSFSDFGVNFIKVESIDENGGFLPEKFSFIDEYTNELLRRSIIEKDDLLFTIAGSLGRSAIVDESILPANTNQAIAIIRPDQSIVSPLYLKYLIRSSDFLETILTKSVHAVQANISLSVISDTEITLPSRDKLHRFSSLITPIHMAVLNNIKQSRTLTALRDTLLPRLMRGEIIS